MAAPRFTTLISTAELGARLADPSLVIVDVRHDLAQPERWGEDAYRQGHLPGARFAHIDRDLSAPKTGRNGRHPLPDAQACARVFGRLGIDATKEVVAYDQGTGMYAARLWWMLRSLGHEAAAVLDGGFAAWTREGRPVTTEIPEFRETSFVARGLPATVDASAIAANLATRSFVLLDARARERYRGDVEPLDPVAGHIPGARQSAISRQPRAGRPVQARRRSRDGVRRAPRRSSPRRMSSTTAGPASPRVTTSSR